MAYEVYEQKLDNNLFKIKIYRAEIYEEHWCRYIFMSALVLIRKLFATNFFFFFFFFTLLMKIDEKLFYRNARLVEIGKSMNL